MTAGRDDPQPSRDRTLESLQRNFESWARTDPLYAVLSWKGKANGAWDVDEFFATGVSEVDDVMAHVEGLGHPRLRGRALDFGCGVGRLSIALAGHFEEVVGIDISESMVNRARSFAQARGAGDRCQFVVNPSDDLSILPDRGFDFVYSSIVLQHIPPALSINYIIEFMRVVREGGLVVFQLPSHLTHTPYGWLWKAAKATGALGFIRRLKYGNDTYMYEIPASQVAGLLEGQGARILDQVEDDSCGNRWVSYRYYVARPAPTGPAGTAPAWPS